jgi:hydroxymethylglutaryl-CoA lyase
MRFSFCTLGKAIQPRRWFSRDARNNIAITGNWLYSNLAEATASSSQNNIRTSIRPHISIIEVGPRDGLQNEQKVLSVETRHQLLQRLDDCGFRKIEAGSLVSAYKVPQMAQTHELLNESNDIDAFLSVLVPTVHHFRQLPQNVDEIVLFVSVSNTFNSKNIGTDIDGAFERFQAIVEEIARVGWKGKIRGSISCCWGCPYEGAVRPSDVMDIVSRYEELGVDMIDLCDTIGVATPSSVDTVVSYVQSRSVVPLSLHLHDTNGQAVESCLTGVKLGIRYLQSSVSGLGGCPFSPNKPGNVDSLKLVNRLHEEMYHTGIDEEKLYYTSMWIRQQLQLTR